MTKLDEIIQDISPNRSYPGRDLYPLLKELKDARANKHLSSQTRERVERCIKILEIKKRKCTGLIPITRYCNRCDGKL